MLGRTVLDRGLGCLLTLQDTKVYDVWFQIDARPFKQALLTAIKRWSLLFKQHLTQPCHKQVRTRAVILVLESILIIGS